MKGYLVKMNLVTTGPTRVTDTEEPLSSKRVLVAEDETDARAIFCEVAARCGFTVIEARDGEMALKMVDTWGRLDAIILDIKMPVLNGYQVIEGIVKKGRHIPIIVCTAFEGLKDDPSIMSYPGIITMSKPVPIRELETSLKKAVLGI